MTVQSWGRVKDVLHVALQLGPSERAAYLAEVCAGSPSLRAEVDSLLLAGEDVRSSFLASPMARVAAQEASTAALTPGQFFAEHYRLIRKLGEGGMGQVWLAEQLFPVRRQVALKLIKAGMVDESVIQRFQSERQSLAMMDHPAIAKVFEAGATPQGQPYFVMEYVPGLPISQYCDEQKLKIRDRLQLFIQACEGVQHAHQKAIIHRDLKPANILVIEVDGKPAVRIIDFGLAKATSRAEDGEGDVTQVGFFMGTPGYMSPEQAESDTRDIDTRTDVYSLGVVLYVLLAGVQPFQAKAGQKLPFEELLRKLREEDPPRPSSKISADPDAAVIAAARATDPKTLVKTLRGDLDAIALKALERDRARRYGTPSDLAADIDRFLEHKPVVACPPHAAYQVRKYIRRHRVGVGVAAAVAVLLAAFTILQTVALLRVTRERTRADRERDRATRITDFMTAMFKVSDPGQARGNSVTAREILDKAADGIGPGLSRDPEAQAQMMQVIATTYANLGLYPRALGARTALLGPANPQTLESMTLLGMVLHREGNASSAEQMERQAFQRERAVLGPDDPLTLESEDYLASALSYLGQFDEAEKLDREVIERSTRKLGPQNERTLHATDGLGTALLWQTRNAEAEHAFRDLLAAARGVWAPDYIGTLRAESSLATSLADQGKTSDAETIDRPVLATETRVLGPDHPLTDDTRQSLAYTLNQEGRHAEAENLYRQSLAIRERTNGPDAPMTLFTKSELAGCLLSEGRLSEAERIERETLAADQRTLGPESPYTLRTIDSLAAILNLETKYPEAEKLARSVFTTRLHALGPDQPETIESLHQLGLSLAHQHRYPEAADLYQSVIARQSQAAAQNNTGSQGQTENSDRNASTPNSNSRAWLVWYEFAGVAAAAGRNADAIADLDQAVSHGFTDAAALSSSNAFKTLRQDPHFQSIISSLRQPSTGNR